jgi:TPR repeat protein
VGAPKNLVQALAWYVVAEKHEHTETVFLIDEINESLAPQQRAQAKDQAEKLMAEITKKQAEKVLAEISKKQHEEGEVVPQDQAKSLEWYKKAAFQGDATAQFALGTMYKAGLGVPKDLVRASAWFTTVINNDVNELSDKDPSGKTFDSTTALIHKAISEVGEIEEALTPAQRAEAEAISEEIRKQLRKT